jgi:hypothetical protein
MHEPVERYVTERSSVFHKVALWQSDIGTTACEAAWLLQNDDILFYKTTPQILSILIV